MTIEKFEGFAIHPDHVELAEVGGVLAFATIPRPAWDSTDPGKRWHAAKAAMSATGHTRLSPAAENTIALGVVVRTDADGVPVLVKLGASYAGADPTEEAMTALVELGWDVFIGEWIDAAGGVQAPIVTAERLGPKPGGPKPGDEALDSTIRAAATDASDVVSWEPDPTKREGDTFERTEIDGVRIMLHTCVTSGVVRWYLIGYREEWTPTREVKMTIACANRPGAATVRALVQLVAAAHEAMIEHFPGRA